MPDLIYVVHFGKLVNKLNQILIPRYIFHFSSQLKFKYFDKISSKYLALFLNSSTACKTHN